MSQIFCSSCGAKHQYTYSQPKFCSSCGQSFGSAFLPPKKQEASARYNIDEEDEDDGENTNIQYVPKIRNLEVDVERDDNVSQFTLGSLFGQGGGSVPRRSRRSKSVDDFISEKSRSGE